MIEQERYDDLLFKYKRLQRVHDDLKTAYNILHQKNTEKEYIIKNELEPRIKKEKKGYDTWVVGGGSDPCFRNGMSGNCNEDCEYRTEDCGY